MGRRDLTAHDFTRLGEARTHPEKTTYGYSQRDEVKRAAFLAQLENPKAAHLVYVDESGMDERDDYGYGYAPAGERFYALKSGRRQGRVNMRDCRRNYSPCNSRMIAGYRDGQLQAPFTVEGACNRTVFETWLTTCLIPNLRPGEWVIQGQCDVSSWGSDCSTD